MKNFDPSRWDIYPTLPENWAITQGATMAPRGYVIIDNQKSRFGGERKHGLMPIKNTNR